MPPAHGLSSTPSASCVPAREDTTAVVPGPDRPGGLLLGVAACLLVSACAGARLVPDNGLPLAHGFEPRLDGLVAGLVIGAIAWVVVDPAAPNWEAKAQRIDTERVEIRLRRKRFAVGGDGEAASLFQKQARLLAQRNGASGFVILSYAEEIESEATYARRVARGVVRLLPPA